MLRATPIVFNLIFLNVVMCLMFHWRPVELSPWLELNKPNVFGWYDEPANDPGMVAYYEEQGRPLATMADGFKPVQVVTYFFSHYEIFHIVFNMLALLIFGSFCETVMGSRRFLQFYLFAGVFSGLMIAFFDPSPNPVLGASGAISGLLVVLAFYHPTMPLSLMFIPFQFTAATYALTAACFSALGIVLNARGVHFLPNVSHFGHLAGMAAGYLYFNKDKILNIFRR